MSRYMITGRFRDLTIMPGEDVDMIEEVHAGWIQGQIDLIGAWIDARLAKRYAVPFGDGYVLVPQDLTPLRKDPPAIVLNWIVAILTPRAYARRGVNPSSGDLWFTEMVINPLNLALADIKEAADGNVGLFDLPMKSSGHPGGEATRSGPKAYTEAGPYVWQDVQRAVAVEEDANGEGTFS